MSITHLPPSDLPRLRLVECQPRNDVWGFEQAFAALDLLTLVQRDVMMTACMLRNGEAPGPGNAIVDGETLHAVLPLALKIIEIGGAKNRDLTLSAAIRHWLQENGD